MSGLDTHNYDMPLLLTAGFNTQEELHSAAITLIEMASYDPEISTELLRIVGMIE